MKGSISTEPRQMDILKSNQTVKVIFIKTNKRILKYIIKMYII